VLAIFLISSFHQSSFRKMALLEGLPVTRISILQIIACNSVDSSFITTVLVPVFWYYCHTDGYS